MCNLSISLGRRAAQAGLITALAVLGLVCCLPAPAVAQLTSAVQVTEVAVTNPNPQPGDVQLPMPCGLHMVFRPVVISVKGLLSDFQTRLGGNTQRQDEFLDRQFISYLASSLTLNDLPADWRDLMSRTLGPDSSGQLYFFGKYEVSEAQWAAVMSGCSRLNADSTRPKADLTWYEAIAFTEKYMNWLLAESPGSLPAFSGDDKNVGLVRLPTEAEWEYAARGGQAVGSDALRTEPLFPLQDGTTAKDYGLFRDGTSAPVSSPARIGRFLPNPLGVYDTLGNVAEMTMDSFKLTVGGRLHGSAGGFVRKGGGFMSGPDEILPGSREEIAYFYKDGPTRARDLGFRLTLSAINTPGGPRHQRLREEWAALGENASVLTNVEKNLAADPLAEIDRLIAQADTEKDRQAFMALRSEIKSFKAYVEMSEIAAVKAHLRSTVHAAYAIVETGRRKKVAIDDIAILEVQTQVIQARMRKMPEGAEKAQNQKVLMAFKQQIENMQTTLPDFDAARKNLFSYYKRLVEDAAAFERQAVSEQMEFVGQDIKGDDVYTKDMRRCFMFLRRDLELAQKGQAGKIKVSDFDLSL